MNVIRHLAHRKYSDMVLASHRAIMREIDKVVAVGVKQDTVIFRPLVTVGQCVLVKLPTLHISRLKRSRMGLFSEYRKDSVDLQEREAQKVPLLLKRL